MKLHRLLSRRIAQAKKDIRCHVTTEKDRQRCLRLEADVFAKDCAFTRVLGIGPESHYNLFAPGLSEPDPHGISTHATDPATNELIAGMRSEPHPENDVHQYPTQDDGSVHEFFQILEEMDALWPDLLKKEGLSPNSKEFFYFFTGCTHPNHTGHGIFKRLHDFTEDVAKQKGFKYSYSLLVSKPMKHLAINKLGYKNLLEIPYLDIEFRGKKLFAPYLEKNPELASESVIYGLKKLK